MNTVLTQSVYFVSLCSIKSHEEINVGWAQTNCFLRLYPLRQTLTHVVSEGPWLIVVKVNVALSVCFGEEGVSEDPTRAVEGKVVSMPVPTGP